LNIIYKAKPKYSNSLQIFLPSLTKYTGKTYKNNWPKKNEFNDDNSDSFWINLFGYAWGRGIYSRFLFVSCACKVYQKNVTSILTRIFYHPQIIEKEFFQKKNRKIRKSQVGLCCVIKSPSGGSRQCWCKDTLWSS